MFDHDPESLHPVSVFVGGTVQVSPSNAESLPTIRNIYSLAQSFVTHFHIKSGFLDTGTAMQSVRVFPACLLASLWRGVRTLVQLVEYGVWGVVPGVGPAFHRFRGHPGNI
uniref:Uncharacterized protein n=1 Tax=Eutreptiella gymnastica TaxID=73025 RepID=A0A7S1J977_9EUGL|mmetsp:Transcript_77216/g.136127  ORF Transcript_77216/g.136127 Transcript_77216/m.136127 type:complete len:111 (+) Transcript_77216:152-484(+)